ncbi:hypothetical protein [Prevotella corporis]|uniref:hypothetical protein n=1 Tax=Prevotella corporis TaxID=28128 RepID=UPI0023FA28B0|nr:hypothetical protein [Prevotella corporis]
MKLKDEEEPYYLVDFCRRKDCQQIKVVDTNDEEIKDFLTGIFENKRKQGNANKADGTLVKVRSISTNKTSCKQLMNMPLYNISPSQARIYTQKCIEYYFRDK